MEQWQVILVITGLVAIIAVPLWYILFLAIGCIYLGIRDAWRKLEARGEKSEVHERKPHKATARSR